MRLELGNNNDHWKRENTCTCILNCVLCSLIFPPGMHASSVLGCGGVEGDRRAEVEGGVALPHDHTTQRGGSREQSTHSHSHWQNSHFTSNDYIQHTH